MRRCRLGAVPQLAQIACPMLLLTGAQDATMQRVLGFIDSGRIVGLDAWLAGLLV